MINKEDEEDIFEEASKEFLDSSYDTVASRTIQDSNLSKKRSSMTPLEVKNWDELVNAMETHHTKRFNEVLDSLPDREFVRSYLKALPFFKSPSAKKKEVKAVVQQKVTIEVVKSGEKQQKIIDVK